MTDQPAPALDRWKHRRRLVYATLLYCAGHVSYIVLWGKDTPLLTQIGLGLLGLAGAVLGAYVFGAAFDDKWQKP